MACGCREVRHYGEPWSEIGPTSAGKLAAARKRTGRTQVDVADAIKVTRTPIQAIERGGPFDRVTGTIREYARLVGWAEGAVEAVLDGGTPTPVGEATAAPRTLADDLPLRIVEEIGDGPLLDTDVIELPSDGSGARMIVVVRATRTPRRRRSGGTYWRGAVPNATCKTWAMTRTNRRPLITPDLNGHQICAYSPHFVSSCGCMAEPTEGGHRSVALGDRCGSRFYACPICRMVYRFGASVGQIAARTTWMSGW